MESTATISSQRNLYDFKISWPFIWVRVMPMLFYLAAVNV